MTNRLTWAQLILRGLNVLLEMPQEAIARDVGVAYSTLNGWINAKRVPHPRQLERIREVAEAALSLSTSSRTNKLIVLLYIHCEPDAALQTISDPLDVLISEMISSRAARNECSAILALLKQRYPTWHDVARQRAGTIESEVSAAGLGSLKATTLLKLLSRLAGDFGEPTLSKLTTWSDAETEAYLSSLPGTDVRIARTVMLLGLGRNVFPVDSEAYRVAVRLGLVGTLRSSADAHRTFDEILGKIPAEARSLYTALRETANNVCHENEPNCVKCPLKLECKFGASSQQKRPAKISTCLKSPKYDSPITAIDLYAGCGGLSLGIEHAGINVKYALDWDKHACATHAHNLRNAITECRDVREISGDYIKQRIGSDVDIVAGGPNCQGVSERGSRNPDDPRNFMFPEFVRLVRELRPRAFIMENVPGLAHRHNFQLLRQIFSSFEALGYQCAGDVLLSANFGVPQLRHRFFLVGTLERVDLSFPTVTHVEGYTGSLFHRPFVTVWDAIADLPFIQSNQQSQLALEYGEETPMSEYQRYVRNGSKKVLNHSCSATDKINLDRAYYIPEGGNWKDIPPSLLPERFFTCRMTDHSTTYARLRRDFPSYTITALFGNITAGAFLHPLINRALSIREGARLQSFPDTFAFKGPRNSQYRQIGNAVPPLLAESVAKHLVKILRREPVNGAAPRITPKVLSSPKAWDALPVLTPRFRQLFGSGTRWPKGWGPEPKVYSDRLDDNYSLRKAFLPAGATANPDAFEESGLSDPLHDLSDPGAVSVQGIPHI